MSIIEGRGVPSKRGSTVFMLNLKNISLLKICMFCKEGVHGRYLIDKTPGNSGKLKTCLVCHHG